MVEGSHRTVIGERIQAAARLLHPHQAKEQFGVDGVKTKMIVGKVLSVETRHPATGSGFRRVTYVTAEYMWPKENGFELQVHELALQSISKVMPPVEVDLVEEQQQAIPPPPEEEEEGGDDSPPHDGTASTEEEDFIELVRQGREWCSSPQLYHDRSRVIVLSRPDLFVPILILLVFRWRSFC